MGIFEWFRGRTGREDAGEGQEPVLIEDPAIDEAEKARARQGELDQALHRSIRGRDMEQCKQLLDDGADANALDNKGLSALDMTLDLAGSTDMDFGDDLETDSEMQAREENNNAKCEKSVEIGLLLIDSGAELKRSNFWQSVSIYNDDPRLCQAMIDKGVNVNETFGGYAALHHVANNVRIARTLLEAGADPNVGVTDQQVENYSTTAMAWVSINGQTPLHEAVSNRRTDMVDALLEFGANMDISDDIGVSALDMAEPELAVRLQSWKVQCQLEANTAPAPARYATDDWLPDATNALEARLAAEAGHEPQQQAPVRQRAMRL